MFKISDDLKSKVENFLQGFQLFKEQALIAGINYTANSCSGCSGGCSGGCYGCSGGCSGCCEGGAG